MKRIYLLLLCLSFLSASAEWKWFNPQQAGFPVIQNQGWAPELEHSYARLPDHAGCSNAGTDSTTYNIYTQSNRVSRQAFKRLQAEDIKDLYYLSHDELNFPADGWVDSVHPSDYGMVAQATAVEKKIREILQSPH